MQSVKTPRNWAAVGPQVAYRTSTTVLLHERPTGASDIGYLASRPAGIQNIKHRTVGGGAVGALRNRFRQDGFKLDEVREFFTNVRQMCARDLVHVGARSASWPSQSQQGANLLKCEPEVAGSPDEDQCPSFGRSVDPSTARRSEPRGQHFDPLIIADGLDVHAAELG